MFDAFSVGGILAIRTKEKKPLLKTGHISAIVAVLLFIICVVSMMRANNVGGKGYNHVLYVKQLW